MTIRNGLRGAGHVWLAVAFAWMAVIWRSRTDQFIALSQRQYARAEELLEWLDQDPLPYD